MKKLSAWKTKGMNQDLSVSAFNPEFSFENMNLRLATNENNTLLSWVNERGTKHIVLRIDVYPWKKEDEKEYVSTMQGIPIGTAILNHQLVVFTHSETNGIVTDYIYKFKDFTDEDITLNGIILFQGNLGFSAKHPLETLVSYEAEDVQKVYWNDTINQPRVINIAADANTIEKWSKGTGDIFFNFVSQVELKESIDIKKQDTAGGLFAPGVIQYCYTYIHKYGQQTNVIGVSPLYYLTHAERGASPEEKVGCSFTITITDPDTNYDYLRLYSIQRTSIDATPIAKLLDDISLKGLPENERGLAYLTYTDNGTTGASVDPTEILYLGGKEIAALTMTEKDQTLFIGNITAKNDNMDAVQAILDGWRKGGVHNIEFTLEETPNHINLGNEEGVYGYKNSLNASQNKITTFKCGETYRFGMQFQKITGEWSEPVYIENAKNTHYPHKGEGNMVDLAYAKGTFDNSVLKIDTNIYKRVRPVVVFPNIAERTVLCQGVLNPTVFNVEDRQSNSPFAQASWFFRPYNSGKILPYSPSGEGYPNPGKQPDLSQNLAATHYQSIYSQGEVIRYYPSEEKEYYHTATWEAFGAREVEIQGSEDIYDHPFKKERDRVTGYSNTQFFVDQSIVTLNSPEIDFDTEVQTYGMDGLKLRVVGTIPINATASAHSITTSSNMLETAYNIENLGEKYHTFGVGEQSFNVIKYIDPNGINGRMITGNYWNDAFVNPPDPTRPETTTTMEIPINFFVFPWNRSSSLNNDYRKKENLSSILKTKKTSNLLYSRNTYYVDANKVVNFPDIETRIHLQENEQVHAMRTGKQKVTSSAVSYYPNIDKVLTNTIGYENMCETFTQKNEEDRYDDLSKYYSEKVKDPISMKYKSTSHAMISLKAHDMSDPTAEIPILPYIQAGGYDIGKYVNPETQTIQPTYRTFWGDTEMRFTQQPLKPTDNVGTNNRLLIGELYKEVDKNSIFGGEGKEAIKNNKWLIGGDAVNLPKVDPDVKDSGKFILKWTIGDTYYQRYDCLKTYPFTNEDTNQLVEILSFMCETHVNIDGRYDANRGQINSVNMSPQNFNLINPVYSQKDNFFTSRIVDNTGGTDTSYPNLIYYSKTKESGADVDLWTNITLASTLELDGDKGQITSLNRFNDQVIAFQDSAISQILYNENVQISSTAGVPIEIANSGKVQGKRYLSDSIGCSNKWSVATSPNGIYFMDSNNKGIYLFNGQVNDLSTKFGFNTWAKKNIQSGDMWNPEEFNNFVSYYDKLNQEVLFINKEEALAYSEKLGAFTSFYNYGNTPYFRNFDNKGIWVRQSEEGTHLWQHQAGAYCNFFNFQKPYWMTLVGNPEPQLDKIFTNVEFRATVDGEGEDVEGRYQPYIPFNFLESWDEYQHGIAQLGIRNGHSAMVHHHGTNASLKRKFRIWRCDIPRDNYGSANGVFDFTFDHTFHDASDKVYHPNDRMRNPWVYLRLAKTEDTDRRTEIHDLMLTYFI